LHRPGPAVTAYVGLGSNLGASDALIEAAIKALGDIPGTRAIGCSSLYRSAPVDAPGPDYLNAVAAVETLLAAPALLAQLHGIETRHGRERSGRNAPRMLDLDLLLYGDDVIDEAGLVVPHPRLHQRAFALLPLLELAPDIAIPGQGRAADLLAAVASQPIARLPR
jgi:2-amino-4-hydroxy-6-hydroxymethyldihydropteridine diphosphokinase